MIADGGYLEIEAVLDQDGLIEGDDTHAVIHDDVLVRAGDAVRAEHRVAIERQERALAQQLPRRSYSPHAAPLSASPPVGQANLRGATLKSRRLQAASAAKRLQILGTRTLGGGITGCSDWRRDAVEQLQALDCRATVLNPRRAPLSRGRSGRPR
ncbi:hypothetical protein [Streptomyces sp. NBC_01373]|uniref:hypothetical protein n=1 Tax=unclassified Streptomyces TaxID=2593676 RepID=UPI0022538A61|nr:hypothetical protein [Streptomyces sp. NBC_01373]MCX4706710.1 hypothetical protein [Streptomyces sp. NBC_01373]